MAKRKFSDRLIKSLKPTAAAYDVVEGNGFAIRVLPSGTKTFCFLYTQDKKRRRLSIGIYPAITLEAAKTKYNLLWEAYKRGENPAGVDAVDEERSFAALAKEFMEKRAMIVKKAGGWKEDQRIIDKDLSVFADRPAGSLTRRDVVLFLEDMRDDRGLGRQVNIIHTLIRRIYAFALEREFPGVDYNPATSIAKVGKENEKDRNLSPGEIVKFWGYLDDNKRLDESTVRCLKFILVTMQRPGECIGIERSEISGDWWTIPIDKMKTARSRKDKAKEQRVFLTDTAKQLLGETGQPFPYPINRHGLSQALLRMLRTGRKDRLDISPAFTPHDLRRTGATLMASCDIDQTGIDKVLGHVLSKVQRTYNRHEYDEAKKKAMLKYEQRLLFILNFIGPFKPY